MTELREYQLATVAQFDAQIAAGKRRLILVAPTGSGKTIIAGAIIQSTVARGQRVLVLAHRREIIAQTSRKLTINGVGHGIIQAGFADEAAAPVQVASVQTLYVRAIRGNRLPLPEVDLLVIDECHHATAKTWRAIINAYPSAVLLGLTATPCRGDGRGLGGIFDVIIECPQVQALIDGGHLVPTRVYAPVTPDLTGVRVQAGDYIESQLADVMDRPQLVGDIVTHWHRLAERCRTVVFAAGVQHSLHIRDEFRRSGVSCDHLDGATPMDERDDILRKLASGAIDVVTNCMVLTEGWDMPNVGCAVLARPTRKMGLYRQMIGRVLRPAPGKSEAIVIDHSGSVYRHGFAEDHVEWTLSAERRAQNPIHEKRGEHGIRSRLTDCSQCGALRVGGEPCRHCGFRPVPPPRSISFVDGDLALAKRNGKRVRRFYSPRELEQWHAMLTAVCHERGYRPGWVAHKFREKFGAWPSQRGIAPITPSPEVRSWVRSRQIAFAKRNRTAT